MGWNDRAQTAPGTDATRELDRWLSIDDVPTPVLHLDVSGQVMRWNPAAEDLLATLQDAPGGAFHVREVLGRDVVVVPGTDHVERSTVTIRPTGSPARRFACLATATHAGTRPDGAVVLLVPAGDGGSAPTVEPWVGLAGRASEFDQLVDAVSHTEDAYDAPSPSGDGNGIGRDADDTVTDGAVCAAVGIVGLDDVNAAFGRGAGDAVLTAVHRRLSDLAGDDGVVDRTGSDRFSVIVPGNGTSLHASSRSLSTWGDRLVAAVRTPVDTSTGRAAVGGSVGLSTGDPRSALVLMDAADRNLAAALRLGAGAVCRDGEAPSLPTRPTGGPSATVAEAQLSGSLVDAIGSGAIDVHFQPVVDLDTGDIVELEAFARWRHEGRDLSAGEFLGAAQRTGVLIELGREVLRAALRRAAGTSCRISVNVSARELVDASFVPLVRELLTELVDDPTRLQLELDANVDPDQLDEVADRIDELRDLQVRVVLDGVGGAASDLAVLRRLRVDGVKVDPATTRALGGTDPWADGVARATLAMYRELGVEVVAKGIEDERHHTAIIAAGCRRAQGYHYAPPVPMDELTNVLPGR